MNATVHLYLDKRTADKADRYPVKIRVTFDRQPRYYRATTCMTEVDFKKVLTKKTRGELTEVRKKIEGCFDKAEKICKELGKDFSFDTFKERYEDKREKKGDDLKLHYEGYINSMPIELNTANLYRAAINSFTSFAKGKVIKLKEITPVWLNKYENWMTGEGKSINTISIYLRSLQTVYNKAVKAGHMEGKKHPFKSENSYTIPSSINVKKALDKPTLKKILEYVPDTNCEPWKPLAHDLWIFCYLCNGINVKDICLLKWDDLSEKNIYYRRAKTAHSTRKKQKDITIPRIDRVNEIIARQGVPDSDYVFGLLNKADTPLQQLARIKQITKNINKWIGRIAEELEIKQPVTTYTARHSFATVLKRGGVPLAFISESLGHSDLKTTENYLDSIEDDARFAINSKLLELD